MGELVDFRRTKNSYYINRICTVGIKICYTECIVCDNGAWRLLRFGQVFCEQNLQAVNKGSCSDGKVTTSSDEDAVEKI